MSTKKIVSHSQAACISTILAAALFATGHLSAAEAQETNDLAIPEITVLGDSNKSSPLDYAPSVSEISGQRLSRKMKSTLGETLKNETGVNSSQFGPNASRPVIRGLDGERIRVLQNGTGVLDASATSQDHAIATDPLVIERIEIVRGPSVLMYGSSAVGGVVNVVLKRIPESKIDLVNGTFESRYSSNDNGRSMGVLVDGPISRAEKSWLFHIDGSMRGSDDYRAPVGGTITNSFNRTWNGALGTSFVREAGFAGISVANYNSQYGTVSEKAVNIDLRQQKYDFSGGLKDIGWFSSAKLKATLSNYQHQEIENGSVGTTFKNNGHEARVDLKQNRFGLLDGFVGLQKNFFLFDALGDEAFLPRTNNSSLAAFVFEEIDFGTFTSSLGARIEQTSVGSEVESANVTKFGASETKSYSATSAAVALSIKLSKINSLVFNSSYTERAPNYQELFANGAHIATGSFEIGDKTLSKEISRAVEVSLRTKAEMTTGTIGVFAQDFPNFVALSPTGATDAASGLPTFTYQAIPARLYGAEIEYRTLLASSDGSRSFGNGSLELEIKSDFVRGLNRQNGGSLPRMPALRESIGLNYKTDDYQADIEIQHSEKQSELATNERETNAYTLVNAGFSTLVHFDGMHMNLSARILNAFDSEARNHVSVLKETAPLPGRSFNLSAQVLF